MFHCPVCNAPEVRADGKLNIRMFKVHVSDSRGMESHCLRCGVWFPERGNPKFEDRHDYARYHNYRGLAKTRRKSLEEIYNEYDPFLQGLDGMTKEEARRGW